jgi:hypothetical protein
MFVEWVVSKQHCTGTLGILLYVDLLPHLYLWLLTFVSLQCSDFRAGLSYAFKIGTQYLSLVI